MGPVQKRLKEVRSTGRTCCSAQQGPPPAWPGRAIAEPGYHVWDGPKPISIVGSTGSIGTQVNIFIFRVIIVSRMFPLVNVCNIAWTRFLKISNNICLKNQISDQIRSTPWNLLNISNAELVPKKFAIVWEVVWKYFPLNNVIQFLVISARLN